ncbi:hypothetical protein BKA93DRAFT_756212, partial [Sparassis latifolia]
MIQRVRQSWHSVIRQISIWLALCYRAYSYPLELMPHIVRMDAVTVCSYNDTCPVWCHRCFQDRSGSSASLKNLSAEGILNEHILRPDKKQTML